MTQIIIAAPAGYTRRTLEEYFHSRADQVISLARETLMKDQQLVIGDRRIELDGEDILEGATAAVVLDSGYMWPMPQLDPTPEEWDAHHGRFDDWLRDERETASLWLSLLDIVNDRVPRVINPQAAFAHAALRPLAVALLDEADVPLPPHVTTNDPDAAQAFIDDHPAEVLALALEPATPIQWLDRRALGNLPGQLERAAVMFQALTTRNTLLVTAVDGQAITTSADGMLPPELADLLPTIQRELQAPWAELIFRAGPRGWVFSDFSPTPRLHHLSVTAQEQVLEAVGRLALPAESAQ